MNLIVLFGLPGTGKTYVGTVLQNDFGFFLHDGDADLPDAMKKALDTQSLITDAMRDEFFYHIIITTKELMQKHTNLVITQTFIKEKYRKQFLSAFSYAQFLLVDTPIALREKRLGERKTYPLDKLYARNMVALFEKPHITHTTLINDIEGPEKIRKQLKDFLNKTH